MKKLLAVGIGIGIAVIFLAGIGAVFYLTSGMVNTATGFFEAVKSEDLVAAREYLSEDFKAGTTDAELGNFLSASELADYQEASWWSREISGGRGDLEGEVTTESGVVVPLRLTFVKENEAWKIFSILAPPAGVQVAATPGVPPVADQVVLITQAVRDFGMSVEQQSMGHFRSTVSHLWRRQITTHELDEIFGITYEKGMDFSFLNTVAPIVEPVTGLGENGHLVLKGYFPTRPDQFHFEQTYVYEGVGWKLYGFAFEIK